MQHHYRLYGLRISSEIELPELIAQSGWETPDVEIRLGQLPEPKCRSDELFAEGEVAGFFIEGLAQYRVRAGHEIVVDPQADAPPRNVRLYLLGSAFGLLLHQRGSLPLHANMIEVDGKGYAFMGSSGAGKSTLAAAFHDKGHRIVGDDVCVVSFDAGGTSFAYDGVPRLRLCEDALGASGRSAANYQLSYAGDERFRKFDVPTRSEIASPVRLSAIFELAPGERIHCERLAGLDAIETIFANTYRGGFIPSAGNPRAHWQACVQLVSSVPIYRLHRPLTAEAMAQIISHFESDGWIDLADRDMSAAN